MLTTSTSNADLVSVRANLEAERASLDLLRRIQPDGRIVLNMHPDDTTIDSIPDIALEDGDEFYVPTSPATVTVIGDVYNQGSFLREPGKTVNSYSAQCRWPHARRRQGTHFCGSRQRWCSQQGCLDHVLVGRVRQHGADARRRRHRSRTNRSWLLCAWPQRLVNDSV